MLLSEEERARGVVAFSSGNHAQGVAIAAKTARDIRNHRHAVRRTGAEGRGHQRARARRSSSSIAVPRAGRKSPPHCRRERLDRRPELRRSAHCRRAGDGRSRNTRSACRGGRCRLQRKFSSIAAVAGLRAGIALACPEARHRAGRAGGLGRYAAVAGTGRDRAGAGRCAADSLRRAPDAARCRRLRSAS